MMSCVFILILLVDWIVSFGFWGCFVVGICWLSVACCNLVCRFEFVLMLTVGWFVWFC